MPSINLRFTDEEHASIKEWAHRSRRSIQQEVIHRLFELVTFPIASEEELTSGAAVGDSAVSGTAQPSPPREPERAAPEPDPDLISVVTRDKGSHRPEFKPDFKPVKAAKKR